MNKCIKCFENEMDDKILNMCNGCINNLYERDYLYQEINYRVNPEILYVGLCIYYDDKYMIVKNIRDNIISCIYIDEKGNDNMYYVDVANIDKIKKLRVR